MEDSNAQPQQEPEPEPPEPELEPEPAPPEPEDVVGIAVVREATGFQRHAALTASLEDEDKVSASLMGPRAGGSSEFEENLDGQLIARTSTHCKNLSNLFC